MNENTPPAQATEQTELKALAPKWYLIQRCAERKNPEGHSGVNRILDFDYMGSAEFEFGALTRSFETYRNLAKQGKLAIFKFPLKTKEKTWNIHGIYHTDFDLKDIIARVEAIASPTYYSSKENPYMDIAVGNRDVQFFSDICCWVNVANHNGHMDSVIWSIKKGLVRRLMSELLRTEPTPKGTPNTDVAEDDDNETQVGDDRFSSTEDLQMFDRVMCCSPRYSGPALIAGIYDDTVDLRLPDNSKVKGVKLVDLRRA